MDSYSESGTFTPQPSAKTLPSSSILILFFHICLCLPIGILVSCFPTKTFYTFLFSPCVSHAPNISSPLTWPSSWYAARSTNHEGPHRFFHFPVIPPLKVENSTQHPVLVHSTPRETKFTQPYKTISKTILLYILHPSHFDTRWGTQYILDQMVTSNLQTQFGLQFFINAFLIC